MSDDLRSLLPSVAVLGPLGIMALFMTVRREWADQDRTRNRRAARLALAAILVQAAHFTEELVTGFPERVPALFGLGAMPPGFFVWFNLIWLAIWTLSAWGLAARRRAALLPLWFLGLAGVANGVLHPALSALARGYVPGLATSPLEGVVAVRLLRCLLSITRGVHSHPGSP